MDLRIKVEPAVSSISEQFVSQLQDIAVMRDAETAQVTVYDIFPDIGNGSIYVYRLMNKMMLTLFDAVFSSDLIMEYELPGDHFELEYCVDGHLEIHPAEGQIQRFGRNALSVSMSQPTKGRLRHIAGHRYKCVSISGEMTELVAYLGSGGVELWQDYFEQLSRDQRLAHFMGQDASSQLSACFLQVAACTLPLKMRMLFYEGKTMEILSQLLAKEGSQQLTEPLGELDAYEQRQIRKVPALLADNLFSLPTIPELAKTLALNRNKLMDGFKLLYGDTIYAYHRRMCLTRAASLLQCSEASIMDIALDVGYSTASNFCSAFKREYGMTPMQYRMQPPSPTVEKRQAAT